MAMQIEFLEAGSQDCPLIRLYGIGREPISSLYREVTRLASNQGEHCEVHKMVEFRALSECALTLFSSTDNESVRRIGRSLIFQWRLTPDGWLNVAELIEPFIKNPTEGTHQWLSGNEPSGDIAVLLSYSTDGHW
jgi:hypothetical protein